MNLLMNGVSYDRMTLKNADTLEQDWPDGVDSQGIDHPRFLTLSLQIPHTHKDGTIVIVN